MGDIDFRASNISRRPFDGAVRELIGHDLVTVRITQPRFENQPDYEAARLIRILRKAGWQPT